MTITQTVDIPDSRRLVIDVPREVPVGRVILTFTPEPEKRSLVISAMSAEQEIELINRNADRLNAEALDVLSYQDIDFRNGATSTVFTGDRKTIQKNTVFI